MLAEISLDGLGIDDVSFPRARKLAAYTHLLGSPSRTESPGAPAPAGHRNNQIHFFDNSGNSSKPPSSDIVKAALVGRKKKQKKRKKGAHNRTGEDNADAHMKRQIMGREVVVAITAGKLDFGPWEQIFYGEFDGRRAKRVLVKIIGE